MCVSVREHPREERTPFGLVSWIAAGIVRRNERMKEFEGSRRLTTGSIGSKEERNSQNIQEFD